MFSITYLEQKILTRKATSMAIEKQEDCTIIFSGGLIKDFEMFLEKTTVPPDLCIISDCYNYKEILNIIKLIKAKGNHSFILLKSDAKFMRAICYLMKNGLHGIFFTDEELIDLKHCVRNRTRFHLSADKTKLITSNVLNEIAVKNLIIIKDHLPKMKLILYKPAPWILIMMR